MEIVEQHLATVDKADAYYSEGLLIVRLAGRRPTACHVVSVERAFPDVEPPAFVARMSIHPAMRCRQQEVDFEVAQAFRAEVSSPEVVVHHAGGELTVAVHCASGELLAVASSTNCSVFLSAATAER